MGSPEELYTLLTLLQHVHVWRTAYQVAWQRRDEVEECRQREIVTASYRVVYTAELCSASASHSGACVSPRRCSERQRQPSASSSSSSSAATLLRRSATTNGPVKRWSAAWRPTAATGGPASSGRLHGPRRRVASINRLPAFHGRAASQEFDSSSRVQTRALARWVHRTCCRYK